MLAEEYAILSRTKGKPTQEEFVFYLNDTGKYHSFKEKLKSTVIQIVKEKFQNESNKKNEMEKMYNDLYVYLINQMHTTINKIFDSVHESEVVIIGADGKPTDKWRRLADEAEFEENFAVAAQYHQERVASVEDSYDPDLWYDYGVFSMRVRDYAKAEQSFREAIAIDMAHLPSLQAYGCILCSKGYVKEAEVFLQSVVDLKGQDAVAWGLLSLYFELVEKSKEARQAFLMGQKLYLESGQQPVSYRNKIASYLLDLQLDVLAEKVLIREEVQDEETFYNMAQVYYIRKEYSLAEEALNNAIKQKVRTEKVWHLFGRIYTVQGKLTEAQQAYETALSVAQESQDALLYLRIGSIYLKLQRYEDAKNMYLQACKYWPCGIAWLGVGISYYRLDDLIHAEQSLNEANIQNNLDPNVWAYLALVCARQQRFEEAQKALKESIKHGLNDEELKKEIGVQQ
jgi:tetratricopeptide (TPR) repeat protein